MKRFIAVLTGSFVVLSLMVLLSPASGKKRICVMNLEDKSGGQHYGWHNVGEGMADMLVSALVESGKFIVIEREQLQKVLDEQGLGMSGAISPQTAAKVGQILGVAYIITGSVTEFGIKESKLGVGSLGRALPFGGGVDTRTNIAKVSLDIRMIDTSSARIVKTATGKGEASSTGVAIDLDAAPSVEFGKDGFDETVIGKAARKAVDEVAKAIIEGAVPTEWSAKIIRVTGKRIYLNSGQTMA